MAARNYYAIVLGGGMAGLLLALKLGLKGFKVALIEREELGGTCLNRGCIPSKAMIASAKVAHQARNAEVLGVVPENVRVDLGRRPHHGMTRERPPTGRKQAILTA